MTSVLKKPRGTKGKSESMQEDLPTRWGSISREEKYEDKEKLIRAIDDNVIGKGNSFCGPYGRRKGKMKILNIILAIFFFKDLNKSGMATLCFQL